MTTIRDIKDGQDHITPLHLQDKGIKVDAACGCLQPEEKSYCEVCNREIVCVKEKKKRSFLRRLIGRFN